MDGGKKVKRRWLSLKNLNMFSNKYSNEKTDTQLHLPDLLADPLSPEHQRQKKAKSSCDLRQDGEASTLSPKSSHRKKLFGGFRFRKKAKSKVKLKEEKSNYLSASQPNIPNALTKQDLNEEFDSLFFSPDKLTDYISPERSFSDPTLTPIMNALSAPYFGQSRDEEREDEVDSGIAVMMTPGIGNGRESSIGQHHHAFMHHPFFQLEILLQEGHDLVIRDSCGTSDPYVKFKVGNKQYYKSRTVHKNLNPQWDEKFVIPIEDVYRPVKVKVYDYDRGLQDDNMGSAEIDLTALKLSNVTNFKLMLSDKGKPDYMGYIALQCTLLPKTQSEKDSFFKHTIRLSDTAKKLKMQIWSGVVTIALLQGRNLIPMDDNGLSDPYVKFRLGNEKYRSKHKSKTLNPKWFEQFDLCLFDDQSNQLEITVYDHDVTSRDDFMGRAVIDLSLVEKEKTQVIEQPLEDGAGLIKLLLTISGTQGSETISDLASNTFSPTEREEICRKYKVMKSFRNMRDLGWLQVKVYKAQGVMAADLGGKSDPFCVLELVNSRLQTHTEYKNLNPEWSKLFTFNVKDVHSILEITVYDEDRDKKVEFLGKIAIPLLKIRNGERRWFALKDKKLVHRTKGAIQLELDFVYNHLKAAIRTVNPKEEKYMQPDQKFKISIMKRNIDRVSQLVSSFLEGARFIQSCFDWESQARSISAFLVFLVIVWNFEMYMLPITLLLIFMKNLIVAMVAGAFSMEPVEDDYEDEDDEEEEDDKEKEEKKSFKERLQAVQEVCLQVQQAMDTVASMGERIKNTFNWTVPWLTTMAVILLSIGVVVLYYIPLRYLILAWGINKFTKKLRAPNAIPNNELLDYLSRVPSDSEQIQYRELRPELSLQKMLKKKRA